MTSTRDPRLALADAATIARTSTDVVEAALKSGDLRDLRRANVDKWVRARNVANLGRRLGVE